MNVRDFLYNFIDNRKTKIIVQNDYGNIFYCGYADGLDDIYLLNRNVFSVNYDLSCNCLCICVNSDCTKVIFHLPEIQIMYIKEDEQ